MNILEHRCKREYLIDLYFGNCSGVWSEVEVEVWERAFGR